tara:strand:+ start:4211 stop:4576 length:366 start_codon:yes stop_codon:yes gene_type:complete
MWYFILIALGILIIFAVWGIFAFPGFWLMVIFNTPIIIILSAIAHADLHEKFYQERYRDSAIIALLLTIGIYIFKFNLPFLLVTDFMILTILIVKGIDLYEWYEGNQETVHYYKNKILKRN